MAKFRFLEVTDDHGYKKVCPASNNDAEYVLTSAWMHDAYNDYRYKYDRYPHSSWYHRHCRLQRVKS